MVRVGIERLERIIERHSQLLLDGRLAIKGNLAIEPIAEDPQIVETEDVVGVAMRKDGRVDDRDAPREELHAQLGRRVDQKVPVGRMNQDARYAYGYSSDCSTCRPGNDSR